MRKIKYRGCERIVLTCTFQTGPTLKLKAKNFAHPKTVCFMFNVMIKK